MAIPSYDQLIDPILRYLFSHPEGAHIRDVHEAVATALQLTEADRQILLPSGQQPVYKNRTGWAYDRLKRAGYSTNPKRGYWKLTSEGIKFAEKNLHPLSPEQIEDLATSNNDIRLRPTTINSNQEFTLSASPLPLHRIASPDDRLESALSEIRQSVGSELLEILGQVPPKFFETIVLDLLHKMGYGANRSDLLRVGGSGDGGIDGVISLDRLGLEKVYVQAKRWQETVGRPVVQAFYGALAGQRANKGVVITTSTFSTQAIEYAKQVEKVVLIDGAKLVNLMIEYEVGVTLRPLKIPKVDSDYFEE